MKAFVRVLLLLALFISSCAKENNKQTNYKGKLTLFYVNDVHAQIDNFSKIQHIISQERQNNNVVVVCSGDIFSGNPVTDNYSEKGFPVVDIMNRVGFDVMCIGNHEFDYGVGVLKERMEQSNFEWICANVNTSGADLPQPPAYETLELDGLTITFLGLIETNGKQNATIPSSHPWKVEVLTFERPENVVGNYAGLKDKEGADLYIALSHLGYDGSENILGDVQLAQQYPYFDLIIGGHSHQIINQQHNNIPVFQAGSYLQRLGKITLTIEDKKVKSYSYELIALDSYDEYDASLKDIINGYNQIPYLNDVIGYSDGNLTRSEVGCFYTDALREAMEVDIAFQNTGGVRAGLDEGDITKREIFEISPFNNGTVIYNMTIKQIKEFLIGSGSGFYYSGVTIQKDEGEINIRNTNGDIIPNDYTIKVGINDYIPAVHDVYFQMGSNRQLLTAAETLIYYLENINSNISYSGSNCYFRY